MSLIVKRYSPSSSRTRPLLPSGEIAPMSVSFMVPAVDVPLESIVALLSDDKCELQGVRRKVWLLRLRCPIWIRSDGHGISCSLPRSDEHRETLCKSNLRKRRDNCHSECMIQSHSNPSPLASRRRNCSWPTTLLHSPTSQVNGYLWGLSVPVPGHLAPWAANANLLPIAESAEK